MNTTILDRRSNHAAPPLSRRAIVGGIIGSATLALAGTAGRTAEAGADPVLDAWRRWRALEEEFAALHLERARIWDALPEWAARVPSVVIFERTSKPDNVITPIYAETAEVIDAWLGPDGPLGKVPGAEQMRLAKLKELAHTRAPIIAEQDRSGLTKVDERIDALFDEQDRFTPVLQDPADPTAIAIAAKMDFAISWCDKDELLGDYPQCVLCETIRDLIPLLPDEMRRALEPIAAMRGRVREAYHRPAVAA